VNNVVAYGLQMPNVTASAPYMPTEATTFNFGIPQTYNTAPTNKPEQSLSFDEKSYQTLIKKLEEKGYSSSQITSWAGYSGKNGNRDIEKMREPGYGNKPHRWQNLIDSLKGNGLDIKSFIQ